MTNVARVQAKKPHAPKALERAIDGAMKDLKKIQSRATEELRTEDAIRGIELKGGKLEVLVDERFDFKPAGLKKVVSDLIKKHGATPPAIELKKFKSPEECVAGAWNDIEKIQNRRTREMRYEDGIAGVKLIGKQTVAVTLKPMNMTLESILKDLVKEHLANNGLVGARIEFVRPAIEPITDSVVVDRAMASIRQVQQRMTTDIRAEDDILNMNLAGDEVRVVLRAHPHFSESDIKATARRHLTNAGLFGKEIVFIRPAIQPMRPPVVAPPSANTMKAKVEDFAADIKRVQSRMTEELRIEDAVSSLKLKGAKVELTVDTRGPHEKSRVVAWAKGELKDRGVNLPLVVKDA